MFRATMCSSSGEINGPMRRLVLVTPKQVDGLGLIIVILNYPLVAE